MIIKTKDFYKAYEKALKDGVDTFIFEGLEFYTPYAKYLLEYIELKGNPKTIIMEGRCGACPQ